MKNFTLFLTFLLAFSSVALAQDKMLTIDDIYDPVKRVPFSGRPSFVQWSKDGVSFRQVQGGMLMRVNAITGNSEPYFDVKKMASVLSQSEIGVDAASKIAQTTSQQFNEAETAILINHNKDLWLYSISGASVKRLTNTPKDEELEEDFSPNGKYISFVRGMNLFVVDVATGKENQLTRDGTETILNGYLDWVYEEELYGRGQKRGYWWSPDSTRIAFLRTDESPVKKFTVINHEEIYQTEETTPYPKAGEPNPLVTLGIADVSKNSIVPNLGRIPKIGNVKLPSSVVRFGDVVKFADLSKYKPEDFLIGRVTWSPDSKAVIFQALNREQTFLDVNAATMDGKVKTVFTEKTPAYVEIYDNPTFLRDGSMIWQSARTGWRHLYQVDQNGKVIRQITDGKWEIRDFYGVDEKNGWAYFSATKDSHIGTNVYRARLDGSKIDRLTDKDGTSSGNFNSTFTHFIHNWSDVNTPPKSYLRKSDGLIEKVLNENKVDVLNQYKLGKTEFLQVKNRDGFEMEAMMIKPPDFDPNKKYPVWSYTYSGPHAPSVRNGWGGSQYMWFQMLAQKGYIIWVCDNRSASGKGEESTWTAYKNLGVSELKDLEDGVKYLKSLPYIDGDRIGLSGWSYGGFITTYAMTNSKLWKIGIAGGSVTDWHLYDSIYTERYMLTPQNNKEGYERTSVLKSAKNLSGKLLLIHGVIDENVHMQNTMQLVNQLQLSEKQFELMVYPQNRHGVIIPTQTKQMRQLMTDFILKNL
jgi:dipeptidyl-peptidase 4